jgi:hypothetical protein
LVTFRFYIVTTVALFLALAIGVVVGSALDERLVSGLESQVARVQGNLDDTVESIDTKNREIDDLELYVEDSAPFAVRDTLADTTLLVVAEDGVDSAAVESLVRRGRQAGAHAEGVIWLHPRWHLTDLEDRETLATTLALEAGSASTVRQAAWSVVMSAMADGTAEPVDPSGAPSTTQTVPPGTATTAGPTTTAPPSEVGDGTTVVVDPLDVLADPVLTALDETDFVRIERVDGDGPESGSNLVVVFVTGQASDFERPGDLYGELIDLAGSAGTPTVVAEVFDRPDSDERYERGSTLAPWREADPAGVSTVDDLDLTAGRVAAILALADLREGVSGHFGYGPSADRVLPEWLGP